MKTFNFFAGLQFLVLSDALLQQQPRFRLPAAIRLHAKESRDNINSPLSLSRSRSRRSILFAPAKIATAVVISASSPFSLSSYAAQPNGLPLNTAAISGLKWADAKVGTGIPLLPGNNASIDYSIASTAGRFPQIYTTKDKGAPYRWKLGDGSTIAGIEKAVLGDADDEIPPMLPGGVRRVIVPSSLGYEKLRTGIAIGGNRKQCIDGGEGSIGPIPPKDDTGAYQRWVQFYCNPRIPYQPDLVLDIKLYGRR